MSSLFEGRAPIGYAHRGYSVDGAENSLAAFQAAVTLGYRHLETDARVTADGVAVAFHDQVLDRLTNHSGRLADLSWRQVSQARIAGREPIPLLEDVLAGFGEVGVNIDVKSHSAIGPTLEAIRRTGCWHRVRLAAFSHARVQALRRAAGPAVASALSPREVVALKATAGGAGRLWRPGRPGGRPPRSPSGAQWPDRAAQVPAGFGSVRLITPSFIAAAHQRGIAVHAWTINRRSEMVRLLELGVDGIITDEAELLRAILLERGQWPADRL